VSSFATALRNVLMVTQAYLVPAVAETQRCPTFEYGIHEPTRDGKDRVDGVQSGLVALPFREHCDERSGDLDWAL